MIGAHQLCSQGELRRRLSAMPGNPDRGSGAAPMT
jgi:hypothetical protein